MDSAPNTDNYIDECEILKLAALPHLGYYKKEEYELIFPSMVLNNPNFWKDKSYKYLPSRMIEEIKKVKSYEPEVQEGNVYSIIYDARMYFNSGSLRNKSILCNINKLTYMTGHRMNLVLHPLVFKDVKKAEDEKRYPIVSLYNSSPYETSISVCPNERGNIHIFSIQP